SLPLLGPRYPRALHSSPTRRSSDLGQPAIVVNITQQPTANLIETADAIDALLPQLREQLPSDIELHVAVDRTGSVRASVREVEIDRKSTRLNSSHVKISYAVFCLKK